MNLTIYISLFSIFFSLCSMVIVGLVGYIFKTQTKRIDEHDRILQTDYKEIRKDITDIKEDVAAIKARQEERGYIVHD